MLQNQDIDPCEVCEKEQATTHSSNGDRIRQECPRCGNFEITGTALSMLRNNIGKEARANLSGWVREKNRSGAVPSLTSYNIENVISRPLPSVADRALGILEEAERSITRLGDTFNINDSRFLAASYSSESSDVEFLLNMLWEQDLVRAHSMGGNNQIQPNGYAKLDELRNISSESSQGFVAMWFNQDLKDAYTKGLEPGVANAGYEPLRIDHLEHINKIDDEIIRQINSSKFLVADFTGHRGGVYFEAGYAMGLGIPVFWTCRETDLSKLHFDIRQFNCIDWKNPEELSTRLSKRLEAVLGAGPKKV